MKRSSFSQALKESLGSSWKVVVLVLLVMFLRGLVELSFLTFMPVFFVQKGFSVVSAGAIYALFIVSGISSGLLSGHIADRIGFKPVFLFTFLFMTLALWFAFGLIIFGGWVPESTTPYIFIALLGGVFSLFMRLLVVLSIAEHLQSYEKYRLKLLKRIKILKNTIEKGNSRI